MVNDRNREVFLELVRTGLFSGRRARLLLSGAPIDWEEVYRLAEEQSVTGIVAAGLDTLPAIERPPQEVSLRFIGNVMQLERRNKAMNIFVAKLIERLRKADIYAILVKGQGIAQCYEKPLWRICGDVDLLLNEENYRKAKMVLNEIADDTERETTKNIERMHQGYQIDGWTVELHGTMHSNLSRRIDRAVDKMQEKMFYGGQVRLWMNGTTQVFLPRVEEDVIYVFTHILQHLFLGGVGLRQVCDWCRLLWSYRESLNYGWLEQQIKQMGLMSEWRALASLAVDGLCMQENAMPFYDVKFKAKGSRLMDFIMEVGNFGHNRDVEWPDAFKRRVTLIGNKITDTVRLSWVFPVDAPRFLVNYAWDGVKGVLKGNDACFDIRSVR